MKLEISLFRFDYKSDYLPYYTKHFIKIKEETTLLDLLNKINEDKEFSYEKNDDFDLVINGIYTKAFMPITSIVENFGKDITIEPISIRRAHKDLLIDDEDFQERISLFSKFLTDNDKVNYKTYKPYFYASNTINHEYNYIGDPALILAYDLIERNPNIEHKILELLSSHECGADYHTSLEKRVFDFDMTIEDKINSIKEKLEITKKLEEQKFDLEKSTNIDFGSFEASEIKHDFSSFNLAYYKGINEDNETIDLLSKLNARIIETQNMHNDLTKNTFHINSDFSLKLASQIILDAFDNNADLLIVDNDADFKIFDSNRKALKKLSGRDVILPVLHKNELAKLASGLHEEVRKNLLKHTINPELI